MNLFASSARRRSVSTREEMPGTARRSAPKRVGPLVLSTQRIWSVHGRASVSSSPAMGQTCTSSFADGAIVVILSPYVVTLQCLLYKYKQLFNVTNDVAAHRICPEGGQK